MKKIRSIQVINVRWFNATAWYALFLSRLLKEAGHETMVIALPGTDSFNKAVEFGLDPVGLDLNTANPLRLCVLYTKIDKLLKEFKPDVVNCHRGESFILWGLLKKFGHKFTLIRTRGDQRQPKNNWPNRFLHKKLANALIVTNSISKNSLIENLKVPAGKINLILGGVDTNKFYADKDGRNKVRAEFGFAEDDFVVGIVGRFDSVKGHKVLIEAVKQIITKNSASRLRLFFIGFPAGISTDDMEAALDTAGLRERCHISGKRQDINACINALDLGILSSIGSEAIARAAVEVLACKVPLLSTDIGIMPDILPREFLLAPNEPVQLAEKIEELMKKESSYAALFEAGEKAIAGMSEKDFLSQTLAVYEAELRKEHDKI